MAFWNGLSSLRDGRDAVHPLSAGYADPDGVAVLQRRNDRDHPGDREIGMFGLVDGLGEDELDRFEMGLEPSQGCRRQRVEKEIAGLRARRALHVIRRQKRGREHLQLSVARV